MDVEIILPIFGMIAVFSIPIVAILTHHQRKMAELIHSRPQQMELPPTANLQVESDIRELKMLVHQQTIAIDDLRKRVEALATPTAAEIGQRLSS